MQTPNAPRSEEAIRSRESVRGWRVPGRDVRAETGIVLVASVMAAWLVWGGPDLVNAVDYQHLHHYYRGFLKKLVLSGEWAWWNPYVALGRPFAADPEAAVFYPPTWLWVFLPERGALWAALAAHVALCGIGVRRLVLYWGRESWIAWVVGLAFALSQPYLASAAGGLIGYMFVMSYWPWWLRWSEQLAERWDGRVFIKLSAAVALAFLAGHPHAFWLNGVVTALYLVGVGARGTFGEACKRVGRGLLGFGGACAAGLMLAAVQVLLLLELSGQGNRPEMSRMLAGTGYLEFRDMSGLLFPGMYNRLFLWGSCLYVGWACVLAWPLALASIREARVRALALIGVACFGISLGPQTLIFDLAYPLLPGFGGFRMVGRFAAFGALALLLLTAYGLPRRTDAGGFRTGLPCVWLPWCGAVLLVALGMGSGFPRWIWVSLAVMGCVLLLMGGKARNGARYAWGAWLVLEALLASMLVIRPLAKIHAPGRAVPPAALKELERPGGVPVRIMAHYRAVRCNAGMLNEYGNVFGNVALTPLRVWYYLHFAAGEVPSPFQLTYFNDKVEAMDFSALPGVNVAAKLTPDGRLVKNPAPGERAWLAENWEQAQSAQTLWQKVMANRSPELLTITESAPPEGWPAHGKKAETDFVRIDRFTPDRIEMTVSAAEPALLVLAEAWYPGWVAHVDGVACEVVPVNEWMRGVWIGGGGERRVVWVYRPTHLYLGVAISVLTAALGGLWWLRTGLAGARTTPTGGAKRSAAAD